MGLPADGLISKEVIVAFCRRPVAFAAALGGSGSRSVAPESPEPDRWRTGLDPPRMTGELYPILRNSYSAGTALTWAGAGWHALCTTCRRQAWPARAPAGLDWVVPGGAAWNSCL